MSISTHGWGSGAISTHGWGAVIIDLIPWLEADYIISGTGPRIVIDEVGLIEEFVIRERPDEVPTRIPDVVPTRTLPDEVPTRTPPDIVPSRLAAGS